MKRATARVLVSLLVGALAASSASGEGAGKTDDDRPHLTPFDWKKTSPGVEKSAPGGQGPGLKVLQPAAQDADELVCEEGIVHPNKTPVKDPTQDPFGTPMGVQHCWKKSDPNTIIERPFHLLDPMTEAVRRAVEGGGAPGGFRPMKKPRIPAPKTKPPKKAEAVVSSTAPAQTDKATPQLLR